MGTRIKKWWVDYDMDVTTNEKIAEGHWHILSDRLERVGKGELLKSPRILDVGCGIRAQFVKYLVSKKIQAIGIDTKSEIKDLGLPVEVGDAHQMPFFKDGQFNIAHSYAAFDTDIYEHDLDVLINEVLRVLEKGGVFFIMDAQLPVIDEKKFNVIYRDENGIVIIEKQ